MAQTSFSKGDLISELAEGVGFKSGLSFSFDRMLSFVSEKSKKILNANSNGVVGMRFEEYEELFFEILIGTGYAPRNASPDMQYFGITLFNQYKYDVIKQQLALNVYELYAHWLRAETDKTIKKNPGVYGLTIEPIGFLQQSFKKYGAFGYKTAMQILTNQANYENLCPWNKIRRIDWNDMAELEGLFKSESLNTYYGSFIDQRYIDYLSNHLNDIGEINWRKFEGLTAEFFKRDGYEVVLGKGRSDGGIDIRIWKDKEDKENPPMILIQCKRYKDDVKAEVVKALYLDVLYEKANSGLIVTSNRVAPGVKKDFKARGYNMDFAERDKVQQWITSMRTPNIDIIV